MIVMDYLRPLSLTEAVRLKAEHPGSRFIAGGTDLMVRMRAGLERPPVLISLRKIDELKGIEIGQTTRIGSMATVSDIVEHPRLGKAFPVLLDAARPFGSMQIRNVATIGGNLCNASPGADLAPALLVLDARVRVAGPGGEREILLENFFLGPGKTCLSPGEVVISIVLDRPSPRARAAYLRKGRVRMDLALVSVAVLLEMNNSRCSRARVAAGAVAPRPLRLHTVEAALEGQHLSADLLVAARQRAEQEISPITDVRTDAEYRRHLTGILFQRAVKSILRGDGR